MKITSKCVMVCAAAALLSGANAEGPPIDWLQNTGTFSTSGGEASVKTSDAEGIALAGSSQTSFTNGIAAGSATNSIAALDLLEPSEFGEGYGTGVAGTSAMGAAGGVDRASYIQSKAGADGKIFQEKKVAYEAEGTTYSDAEGAALGGFNDFKVGQVVDGSFVEGEATTRDYDGVNYFGFGRSTGVTAAAESLPGVLATATATQDVNDLIFDQFVLEPSDDFLLGRKLLEGPPPSNLLVVAGAGGSELMVANGGTAQGGQINVASAVRAPLDLSIPRAYRGTQTKSLAAASVGPMGDPYVVNGADTGGMAAAGNACSPDALFFGVLEGCGQSAESGQMVVAANQEGAVGLMSTGGSFAMNDVNQFESNKATSAANLQFVESYEDNTGFSIGSSFGIASEATGPGLLVLGTKRQADADFEVTEGPIEGLLDEVLGGFDIDAGNFLDAFEP